MEKIYMKRIKKTEIAELMYDLMFFLENEKTFLQVKSIFIFSIDSIWADNL